MKTLNVLILFLAVTLNAQTSKTPINNGILQSNLDAAGYKVLNANLVDYAGTGLTWNTGTKQFDVTGGGGGGTPGGSTTQLQYNNAGSFGGVGIAAYSGGELSFRAGATLFYDGTDNTKRMRFSLVNVPTSSDVDVLIPNSSNPVVVASSAAVTNNFMTGISALGVITRAQPAFTDISGTATSAQVAATLTGKRITPRVLTITSSGTPTIDTDSYDAVTITAQAAAITSMTSNLAGTPTNFQKLIIRFKDDGTARAITWGASFVSSQSTLPTTTVASKVTTVGFGYDTVKAKWICLATDQEP